nr:hypothetical transcript [Hymenolepis microstoma]
MIKRLAASDRTCRREYFQRFKSGGGFVVEGRHIVKTRAKLKKNYQNHWVGIRQQAISKHLKPLGIIEKERYWAPHVELKPRRDVKRSLFVFEQLLLKRQTRKGFLHRIVTGHEKWVHYNNPKGAQTIMGIARWSYCYVNTSADEYPWLKSHALRLEKSADWLRLTGLSQILMIKRLAASDRTCRREYFQRFKSGGGFVVEGRHIVKTRAKLKKNYQNHWVGIRQQAISKHLKPLGIIEKERYWAPHVELKPRRDVKRSLFVFEQLLLKRQTRKGFLHRIVTGHEKWVHYNNPKGAQTIMGIARWSYCYVNTSADEYPWLKSHALRLVGGPAWRNLL